MNGIIDSISNLLMPLCSVWIVNKFVNNSFEKKESKKIFRDRFKFCVNVKN